MMKKKLIVVMIAAAWGHADDATYEVLSL